MHNCDDKQGYRVPGSCASSLYPMPLAAPLPHPQVSHAAMSVLMHLRVVWLAPPSRCDSSSKPQPASTAQRTPAPASDTCPPLAALG